MSVSRFAPKVFALTSL